jgi:hypothetical protein
MYTVFFTTLHTHTHTHYGLALRRFRQYIAEASVLTAIQCGHETDPGLLEMRLD